MKIMDALYMFLSFDKGSLKMTRLRDLWKLHCAGHTLPSMTALTKPVISVLNRLNMRPDAARSWIFFFSVGNIFWEDEMPDRAEKARFSETERNMVHRLFEIRRKVWHDEELSDGDAAFWKAARGEAPGWALFQRLSLSDDDYGFLKHVEKEGEKAFELLCAEADEVEVTDNGEGRQEFSLKFDLTKNKNRQQD